MGKVDDYASGRADGLQMALKLVEEGGVEALKQEIKFRNITGINTVMCKKETEKATEKIKAMTCDTILALSVLTIRDEFDFGRQRCERFIKRFNQKTECLLDDMLKWKDVLDTVREEMGIDLSIRKNDRNYKGKGVR